jgi:16S rRNA (guanine966-N2)-methyltransferase
VQKTGRGQVRIIAGSLRGSKIPVPELDGLRPTSDRTRETLFNWLQHDIAGAQVLDLFAGSGALGFEAASRGAEAVVLVERNPVAMASLEETKERLKTENLEVVHADALAWLPQQSTNAFNLVFLDPPFATDIWPALWPLLMPILANTAKLYIELPVDRKPLLPEGMTVLKQAKTQHSGQILVQWQNPALG